MVARAVAMRRRSAGEVERTHPLTPQRGSHRLHHTGTYAFLFGMDLGGEGGDIDRGVGKRGQHVADVVRGDGREIALQVDDDLRFAGGVELFQRLENPVRAGGVVGARHDRLAAMGLDRGRDLRRVGGNRHSADPGLFPPAQHVDDHRQSGDVHQRLARQPARSHAGWNQHQVAGLGHVVRVQDGGVGSAAGLMGMGRSLGRLYGLPEQGQTDISSPAWGCGAKARFPLELFPRGR